MGGGTVMRSWKGVVRGVAGEGGGMNGSPVNGARYEGEVCAYSPKGWKAD